jgi:hypothetical protein
MIRMVKVLEAIRPEVGYMAEVPGQDGRYVRAESIAELRSKLRMALIGSDGSVFVTSSSPEPRSGYSDTALFVAL